MGAQDGSQHGLAVFGTGGRGQLQDDLLEKVFPCSGKTVPSRPVVGCRAAPGFRRDGQPVAQGSEHGKMQLQIFRGLTRCCLPWWCRRVVVEQSFGQDRHLALQCGNKDCGLVESGRALRQRIGREMRTPDENIGEGSGEMSATQPIGQLRSAFTRSPQARQVGGARIIRGERLAAAVDRAESGHHQSRRSFSLGRFEGRQATLDTPRRIAVARLQETEEFVGREIFHHRVDRGWQCPRLDLHDFGRQLR